MELKMKTSPALLIVILLLDVWTACVEGSVFSNTQSHKLESFVRDLIQCHGVVGMTVGVVKDNDVWTRGFGKSDKLKDYNVTSACKFSIGSNSKAFSSALLSILLKESNQYTWNTPVATILGKDFKFIDDRLTVRLTVKDILTHRTGLENGFLPILAGITNTMDSADYAKRLRYLPVKSPYRDSYQYNQWIYALAGRVAEKIGGATWEDLLHTRILVPLGMDNTNITRASNFNSVKYAKPYVLNGKHLTLSDYSLYSIGVQTPAAGISSSADDMVKWLRMFLNNGKASDGSIVLDITSVNEMTSSAISLPPSDFGDVIKDSFPVTHSTYGYGYGWKTGTYRGYKMVSHTGGIFAFSSYAAFIKDLDMGVFIGVNGPKECAAKKTKEQVFYFITDLAMGKQPWLNSTTACTFPEHWVGKTKPKPKASIVPNTKANYTTQEAQNFQGNYGHLLYGDVEVIVTGSNVLMGQYGTLKGRLYKVDGKTDVALLDVEGPLAFFFNKKGQKHYVKFHFSMPSASDGKYQKVKVSSPDLDLPKEWPFMRGVQSSDPVP